MIILVPSWFVVEMVFLCKYKPVFVMCHFHEKYNRPRIGRLKKDLCVSICTCLSPSIHQPVC